MKSVLVTGGCGFLGGWVVRELTSRGHRVRILDAAAATRRLEFVEPGLASKVELVAGDVTRAADVVAAAEGCESAVHLAGVMTVECRRDPVRAATINVIGSLNLFEAALACGLGQVCYVSTADVYGADDGEHPFPMSHYGAFKLAVEGSARAYWIDHKLPSVGFRPYIIYGPGESSGISAGPSIACRAAHEGKAAEIRFTGRVGFVHVEDVARAFVAAVEADLVGAEAYNLSGETATVADFIGELKKAAPGAEIFASGDPLLIAPDLHAGSRPQYLAAQPVTGIAEGIARTLSHYDRCAGPAQNTADAEPSSLAARLERAKVSQMLRSRG